MIRPIRSILFGTGLLLIGNGLLSTLIVLRGNLEGYSDQMLGFMGSAYFIGFILGSWLVPSQIRRIGHIRAFAFFAATIAAIMLAHAIIINPWVWFALRLTTGIVLVGFYTVIESWLNTQSRPEYRGQVFAFYMVVNMLAIAGAQQFLHFASPESFVLFSVAAMMVCLSVLPVSSTRLQQPVIHNVPRLTLGRIWDAAPAAMLGALASGLAMGTFWALGPLYAARLGMEAGAVAMFMTLAILGGGALQWPLGRLSDRGDRRLALGIAAAGATLAGLAMLLINAPGQYLLAAAFTFGGMAFAIYPIVVAHLADHLTQDDILSGSAGILLLHGIGAAIGPAVSGALMEVFGPATIPAVFVVVFAPLAMFALTIAKRTEDEIVEEAAQFVPMVRTASTAAEIAVAVEEYRIEQGAEAEADTSDSPDSHLTALDKTVVTPVPTDNQEAELNPGTEPDRESPDHNPTDQTSQEPPEQADNAPDKRK